METLGEFLNRPLVNRVALTQSFKEAPKEWSKLPAHYVDHLKSLWRDPKKLRLALTDVTPLSVVTTALSIPATLKLLEHQPKRRAQTVGGFIGNTLGGQLMQRTGLVGGLLGAIAGEALGRIVAAPLDRQRGPVAEAVSHAVASKLKPAANVAHKADDLLQRVQASLGEKTSSQDTKVAFSSQSPGYAAPNITGDGIAGQHPSLQDVPGQLGSRDSIADRGNSRPDSDTLQGLLRFLGAFQTQTNGSVSTGLLPSDLVGPDDAATSSAITNAPSPLVLQRVPS